MENSRTQRSYAYIQVGELSASDHGRTRCSQANARQEWQAAFSESKPSCGGGDEGPARSSCIRVSVFAQKDSKGTDMKRKGWFQPRVRGVGSRRLVFEPLERRELLSVVIEANGSNWCGETGTRKGGNGGSVDVRFNWNFDGGNDKEINAQGP